MTGHLGAPRVPRRLVDFGLLDQGARASLTHVEAQLFPLLADRNRLQHFLDRRYNDTLAGCGARMELLSPIVLFAVLYYPTMHGYERAEASILQQDEYYYLIPVRLRRRVGGHVHEEVGVVIPYVYVTSPISTPVGRELFGWQKELYRVRPIVPRGIRPSDHEPYLVIERPVPGRSEQEPAYRTVLEMHYRSISRGLVSAPGRLVGALKDFPLLSSDLMRTFAGELAHPGALKQYTQLSSIVTSILRPDGELRVFAMPQVPHPSIGWVDDRELVDYAAAYQGLMRTRMRVRQIREISPLGFTAFDPGNGFSLHLRGHGVGQVVSLGLKMTASHDDGTPGGLVHEVRPYFPLTARFDLEVEQLETLAQRTVLSPWMDAAGNQLGVDPNGDAARYNAFLGPHLADGYTSYSKNRHEQHYRMMGMRAPLGHLQKLCDDIAPMPPGMTLRALQVEPGVGVCTMVITRLPPSKAVQDRLEWFAGLYINVAVVAELSWQGEQRMVFLETHGFTENPHAFLVGRELLGANRWLMEADESPQPWVPAGQAPGGTHVLSMRTAALRTLNAGERVEMSPFLDVVECDQGKAPSGPGIFAPHIERLFAARELAYLRVQSIQTTGAAGTLEPALLRGNIELVRFARDGQSVPSPQWLQPHDLFIHPYASMPMVSQLGLRAEPGQDPRFDRGERYPAPERVRCDFAVGGYLPATRRAVLTLFDWSRRGWRSDMAGWFFRGDPVGEVRA